MLNVAGSGTVPTSFSPFLNVNVNMSHLNILSCQLNISSSDNSIY